jgi:hypothetical protein
LLVDDLRHLTAFGIDNRGRRDHIDALRAARGTQAELQLHRSRDVQLQSGLCRNGHSRR